MLILLMQYLSKEPCTFSQWIGILISYKS